MNQAELTRLVQSGASQLSAGEVYADVQRARKAALILEKSILTRASPLLPKAIKLGLRQPAASLRDYEEWFGDRAAKYANPGDVASMFSPAAYLTALYREARTFYAKKNPWHIDQRRPDLASLVLSQDNMDTEVSALALSIEIMLAKVRASLPADSLRNGQVAGDSSADDAVLNMLSTDVHCIGTPYHHYHAGLRQVCAVKDPDFAHLASSPAVTSHLSESSLAAIHYDIPPALYQLLTEEITEANAEERFKHYFGTIPVERLLNPKMLRQWYGLSDKELWKFIGDIPLHDWLSGTGEYIDNNLLVKAGSAIYRLNYTLPDGKDYFNYVHLYPQEDGSWLLKLSNKNKCIAENFNLAIIQVNGVDKATINSEDYGDATLLIGKEYTTPLKATDISAGEFELGIHTTRDGGYFYIIYRYNLQVFNNPAMFALKLNKAIRLYKATGLAPRVLEEVVNSVNPEQITDDTLSLLFRTSLLTKKYALSYQDAQVMARGTLSLNTIGSESSQFDRLFNSPVLVEGGFWPDNNKTIDLSLDKCATDAAIKATLKRACQTDDTGLLALFFCWHKTAKAPELTLTLTNISSIYTLSLWARLHGLTPGELHLLLVLSGLPDDLSAASVTVWNQQLSRIQATVRWLARQGWSVQDLVLMTRPVTGIPASTDIRNFLAELQALITASDAKADREQKIRLLAPLIAATFTLNSDSAAAALLRWAHQAEPGELDLEALWAELSKAKPETAFSEAVVAFAYGLAQRALIIHASGVTSEALTLFVAKPQTLDNRLKLNEAALPCSLAVIMALSAATQWLSTLADSAGTGGALLNALNDKGVDAALLAQATGLNEALITQAMTEAQAQGGLAKAGTLHSYSEIDVVLQWLQLAASFGVMPVDISHLLKLNYTSETGNGDDWEHWQQVAQAFLAGLTPSQTAVVEAARAPGLSAALSGWLTTMQNRDVDLTSREVLHRYLLTDSLNGPQVKTSRLAAAVEALQSFIHRTLSEPEGPGFNTAVLSSAFMRDWTQWNSRYSTWVAAQKLMYYPENYIDPTVRLGQTQMMDDMLQVLGQAQINTDTVGDAFMGYLNGFEAVANLETVSAYYDARYDSSATSKGKTWFIGRSESEPREYWWRTVDESKRGADGKLPANAWTSWTQITCSPQPYGELIRPVVYKKRLYLGWVERQKHVTQRGEDGKERAWEYLWTLKMAWRRYDGNWSTPASYPLSPEDVEKLEGVTDAEDNLSLYLSAWPEQQYMMAALYNRSAGVNVDEPVDNWGAMRIFENMHAEPHISMASDLITELSQLDTPLRRGVCAIYFPPVSVAELKLKPGSALPTEFALFEENIAEINLITTNDGKKYQLEFTPTLSVSLKHAWNYTALDCSLGILSELRKSTMPATAYVGPQSESFTYAFVRCERNGLVDFCGCFDEEFFNKFNFTGADWANFHWLKTTCELEFADLHVSEVDCVKSWSYVFFIASTYGRGLHGNIDDLLSMRLVSEGSEVTFHLEEIFSTYSDNHQLIFTPADFTHDDNFSANEMHCQVTGPNNQITTVPYRGSDIPMSQSIQTVMFPDSTLPEEATYYSVDDWGNNNTEYHHKITFQCGEGNTREYTLRVYKQADKLVTDLIVSHDEGAQYLQHGNYRTRLNTLFARQLTERANSGIDTILSYETQQLPEPPVGEGAYLTITLPAWDKDKHSSREAVIHLDDFLFWSGNLTAQPQTITLFAPCNWKAINGIDGPPFYFYRIKLTMGGKKTEPAHLRFTKDDDKLVVTGILFATREKPVDGHEEQVPDDMPDDVSVSARWKQSEPMDFSGANALYFWELFYYSPMMVMQRFLQEARFDQAESWLKYVFNPAGYLVNGEHTSRMWNVRPLEEDLSWNSEPLNSWDPDAVAQNDPMHYKLNAFMRLLDIIIGRGDSAYRKLERDTLAEAKVWYDRAFSLLGEAPWIAPNVGWTSPVLGMMAENKVLHARFDVLSDLAQGRCAAPERKAQATAEGSTLFCPEANDIMLGYWETLNLRLYNLRHNLTLDGQPLNLALWATPADPKALLASAVASENGSGGTLPTYNDTPALRFMPLLDSARGMAGQLIQFGSSLLQVLERQDSEALAELLLAQGGEMADSSLSLQKQQLNELAAERATLTQSLVSATQRRNHFNALYEENINRRETEAMNLLTSAQMMGTGAQSLYVAAGAAALVPNVFGLANGGSQWAGPLSGAAIGFTIAAEATSAAGQRVSQEEMYRRRREEWDVQRKMAEGEMAVVQAQLDTLTVRETSAGMQIKQMETQLTHAKAQLTLLQGKFTGKAMYSWLRSRLSTIFFQFYDLTASRCLMAQKALQWEKNDSTAYLRTGTWNGSWAGLTSGEGLMLALAQMEDAWLRWQKREKEITRTVSLNNFLKDRLTSDDKATDLSLAEAVRQLLAGTADASLGKGKNKVERCGDKLAIHFDLADMAIKEDGFGNEGDSRRVRTVAVTLPMLLGPYQNIRAVLRTSNNGLPPGCNECVISHAQGDNGLFSTDGADPRWLPFEGLPLSPSTEQQPVENGMTLSFADATGSQKVLLENLSDVIIHIQYILR
ncbi:neuraminidase-like domain-containing protein [Enterobacteriaceae bacterium LUAb1]